MTPTSARHRRLRLVVGAPGAGPAGIQEAFVDDVRRLKQGDPLRPISVLVGSNYLRLHLQRLLAVRLGGHANIRFLLMKDLARDLGTGPLLDKGRRRLPEFGRELLLREAVAARSHGTYFEHIAGKEGFIEALGATIRDMKEAALEPAMLRAAAKALSSRGRRGRMEISARKLEDLADLFETYDDLLRDRRLYDDEDLMRVAASLAAGSGAETALVYGFYDAYWLQRLLIKEYLAFREGAVYVPLESGAHAAAYDFARPLLEWLAEWIPVRVDLQPAAGEPARGRAAAGPVGPEVTFLSAPGEAREAVEATRWLISLARDRSLPFGEMGILYRSAEAYGKPLAEVMGEAGGVPHFMADGFSLASTPSARALLLLLQVRRDDFSRRSLIELLALVRPEEPTALWDRLSREAGVVKGIQDWRHRLERMAAVRRAAAAASDASDRLTAEEASRALGALRERVEEIHAALHALPAEATWRALAGAAADLLRRLVPSDPSRDHVADRLASLGGLDDVSSPVTLDEFLDTARRALEEKTIRAREQGEFQRSGIFVGSVMDARLLSFQAVALVGLVERGFPAPARQDPILLDEEREEVNGVAGAGLLALKARRLEEERLLFRLACTSAAEALLLGYPRLEPATARPRNPSPFLLRTAAALEGRLIDYETLESLPRMRRVGLGALAPRQRSAAIFSREFDLGALRVALEQQDDQAARRRAASFLHANPILHRALEAEEARWGEPRFTEFDGVILRPSVLDALRAAHPAGSSAISATHVEAYASCPLAYFMEKVLNLRAVEDPEQEDRIDPLRRGGLVHRILFEVYSALKDRGALPLTPHRLEEARVILQEVAAGCFRDEEALGVPGFTLLWEIDKQRILDDLDEALAREAESGDGFVPLHFEIRYGMPRRAHEPEDPTSSAEPVQVDLAPGRAVALKGRIDRVDLSPDGGSARVTDYKTGRMARYRDDSLQGGRSVQLPLYMLAVEKALAPAHPQIRSTSARYVSVDRAGKFREVAFSAEALARRKRDLDRILATYTYGVARGVFFAYPDPEVCRCCDYRLACGEGREERLARKRNDGTAADYLRMREGIP